MNNTYAEVAEQFRVILRLLGFNVDLQDAYDRLTTIPNIMAAAYLSIIGCLGEGVSFADEYKRLAGITIYNWTEYKRWVEQRAEAASVRNLRTWKMFFGKDLHRVITLDNIITYIPRICVQSGLDNVITRLTECTKNKSSEQK